MAADVQGVWRLVDLWRERQSRVTRFRHRPRLSRSAHRSATRAADIQDTSVRRQLTRRRQDDPLWREVVAIRRLVVDPAGRWRWLDDRRRFGRLPQFATAERYPPGD